MLNSRIRKLNSIYGASPINLTLSSIKTFIFSLYAIHKFGQEQFRLWFVMTGIVFGFQAIGRSAILEPFLLKRLGIDNLKKVYIWLTTTSFLVMTIVVMVFLHHKLLISVFLGFGAAATLICDRAKYVSYRYLSRRTFYSEGITLLLSVLVILLANTIGQIQRDYLVMSVQFHFIPIVSLILLSRKRKTTQNQLKSDSTVSEYQKLIKVTLPIAILALIFSHILILYMQEIFNVNDLKVLKSIEVSLMPSRNILSQIWTSRLVHKGRDNLISSNSYLSGIFLLFTLTSAVLISMILFSSAHSITFYCILFCYSLGFSLSFHNQPFIADLLMRNGFVRLWFSSFWHYILGIGIFLIVGENTSLLSFAVLYNLGLWINLAFANLQNTKLKP